VEVYDCTKKTWLTVGTEVIQLSQLVGLPGHTVCSEASWHRKKSLLCSLQIPQKRKFFLYCIECPTECSTACSTHMPLVPVQGLVYHSRAMLDPKWLHSKSTKDTS
jgi:hypothetical protein